MGDPPEFWLFVVSNAVLLLLGGVLTTLSVRAYGRTHKRAFWWAIIGFGLITAGGLVEAVYELGIRGSYELGGRELLALHTVEGVVLALGLGSLFYSLNQY